MKKFIITIAIFLSALTVSVRVMAQAKAVSEQQLVAFKEILVNIKGSFVSPEGFQEIKPPVADKLAFQYGLKLADADFEIWFQVNSIKNEWQQFNAGKQFTNPDSLYIKTATEEAVMLSGSKDYLTRTMPPSILSRYNADEGKSFSLMLTNLPFTSHYQYALLIVLQKNHYGNLVAVCLGNERGPAFYKNVKKLKDCFKFAD